MKKNTICSLKYSTYLKLIVIITLLMILLATVVSSEDVTDSDTVALAKYQEVVTRDGTTKWVAGDNGDESSLVDGYQYRIIDGKLYARKIDSANTYSDYKVLEGSTWKDSSEKLVLGAISSDSTQTKTTSSSSTNADTSKTTDTQKVAATTNLADSDIEITSNDNGIQTVTAIKQVDVDPVTDTSKIANYDDKYNYYETKDGTIYAVEKSRLGIKTTSTDSQTQVSSPTSKEEIVLSFGKTQLTQTEGGTFKSTTQDENPPKYYFKNTLAGQVIVKNPEKTSSAMLEVDSWMVQELNNLKEKNYQIAAYTPGNNEYGAETPHMTEIRMENSNEKKFVTLKSSTDDLPDTKVVTEYVVVATKKEAIITNLYTIIPKEDGYEESLTHTEFKNVFDGNGNEIKEAPFASDKWHFKTEEGKYYLTYNGEKGTVEKNVFVAADGSMAREFKYGDDRKILEWDGVKTYTLIDPKTNKKTTINYEIGQAIIGKNFKAEFTEAQQQLITRVDDIKTTLDYNRLDPKDLEEITKEGTIAAGDYIISLSEETPYKKNEEETLLVFKSKNGKEIVKYDELNRPVYTALDGKDVKWQYNNDGTVQSFETSTDTFVRTSKGGEINVYCSGGDQRCIDISTGLDLRYDDNLKKFVNCDDKCGTLEEDMKPFLEQHRKSIGGPTDREQRAIRLFSWLEASQTGVGKFFSLFMSDEDLAAWRNKVDNFFCGTVLFGGKDCWVSKVCEKHTDKVSQSALVITTPVGTREAVAHVEGERYDLSFLEEGQRQGEYLYKISFAVKLPEDYGSDVSFNVLLTGDKTTLLSQTDWNVDEGNTINYAGKDVIVDYSDDYYNRICIVFRQKIPTKDGKSQSNLCNDIVDAKAKPDNWDPSIASTPSGTGTTKSGPAKPIDL